MNYLTNSLMSLMASVLMQSSDQHLPTNTVDNSQKPVCTDLCVPQAQQRLGYALDSLKYAQVIQHANPYGDINIHVLGLYIQPSTSVIRELQKYEYVLSESVPRSAYVLKCEFPDGTMIVSINNYKKTYKQDEYSRDLVSRIFESADSCVDDCFNSSNGMGVNSTQQEYRSK